MPTYIERAPIPSETEKLIDLGMKVYAKHYVMSNKSSLLAMQISQNNV